MSLLNSMLGGAAQGLGGSLLQQQQEDMLAHKYQQALAESMMNTKMATVGAINSATGTQGVYARSAFDPNASAAYQIPLSQLVTLWQAKFNDVWVDMGIEHETFWRHAHRRLHNANKFENAEGWVRLLEDA